ncbi:hypothetical protein V8B97DRAFT_2011734 [Scleroderma yunnanense]
MSSTTAAKLPTNIMPTEIIVDVTNSIKAKLDSIKSNKSKDHWKKQWYSIIENMNHVHTVIGKLPHRTSVPTLLLAMDMHLPTPEGYGGWPGWQLIIQYGPTDIAGHPWVRIGSPEPGEQGGAVDNLSAGKDKGKEVVQQDGNQQQDLKAHGRDLGPTQHSGHSKSHGHSQLHHPCRPVKSVKYVNTDDEGMKGPVEMDLQEACTIPWQAMYNLQDPPTQPDNIKLTCLPPDQVCALCAC